MQHKRRTVDDLQPMTREELLVKIRAINNIRDRALAAFIYLSGCRISEIVGKIKHIGIYQSNNNVSKRIGTAKSIEIKPLCKENLVKHEEDIIVIENVPCLKWRKSLMYRNVPIRISSDNDFLELFMPYYNTLPPGSQLFKISRQRAWQIINKHLGIFTHALIHKRCTDLVTLKGFPDQYLKQFRGWKDSRYAQTYTHLNWHDVAQKM